MWPVTFRATQVGMIVWLPTVVWSDHFDEADYSRVLKIGLLNLPCKHRLKLYAVLNFKLPVKKCYQTIENGSFNRP